MPIDLVCFAVRRWGNMGTDRVGWVDTAKGATILLVVFHHAVMYLHVEGWAAGPLVTLTTALQTFRMPLFFLASGLFFTGNLSRSWGDLMGKKVGRLAYLFLAWSVAAGVFLWWAPWQSGWGAKEALLSLVWPSTWLWFIYALALYFVATRALSRIPLSPTTVAVVLLSFLFSSDILGTGNVLVDGIIGNFVYFFVAAHYRSAIFRLADRRPLGLLAGCTVGWLALLGVAYAFDLGASSVLTLLMASLVLIAAVIVVAWVAETPVGRVLAVVGEDRTLPVFVLHMFMIPAAAHYLPTSEGVPTILMWVAPFALSAVAIVASLTIWRATRNINGVFSPPWENRIKASTST